MFIEMFPLRAIVYSFMIYGILVAYSMNPENITSIKIEENDNIYRLPGGMLEGGWYGSRTMLNSVYYNTYECSGVPGSTDC